ncbi:MAG: hypothetical protein DRJ50_10680 [Actinobacteria bacterium]|nr:MAG: hypothetical protein DRJ50_10680 [Actinomycetota bacterium]
MSIRLTVGDLKARLKNAKKASVEAKREVGTASKGFSESPESAAAAKLYRESVADHISSTRYVLEVERHLGLKVAKESAAA